LTDPTTRPIAAFAHRYGEARLATLAGGPEQVAAETVLADWVDGSADLDMTLVRLGSSPAALERFLLQVLTTPVPVEGAADLVRSLGERPHLRVFHMSAGAHLAFLVAEEMLALGREAVALTLLAQVPPLPRKFHRSHAMPPETSTPGPRCTT